MKKLLLMMSLAAMLAGCSKKKQVETIIVQKPQEQVISGVKELSATQRTQTVDWGGNKYSVNIERQADKDLPQVKDENGQSYYDNTIHVVVNRADGSTFCDHLFTKAYLLKYCSSEWAKNGALIGLAFDHVEPSCLVFSASLGSPDELSDQFEPLLIKISRFDEISVERDTHLDTASEDDGV